MSGGLLYLLLSGRALWVGFGLTLIGVAIGGRWPRIGVGLALIGTITAGASSVPLHPALYCALSAAGLTWLATRRRSRTARTAASALLSAVVLAMAASEARFALALPKPSRAHGPIYVLGDSLTAGLGRDRDGTWPALVASSLGRPVHNLARPGARLRDGILQASALAGDAGEVLIELGGNDILGGVAPAEFARDLRNLLERVSAPDRTLVMFELPLLPLQNAYGRAQRELASEFGVRLLPRRVLASAVAGPGHTIDGLHLSRAGHACLANEVSKALTN
ncbi:MAG: SGNH/GDSL hydrolase family protein [Vicinamibacteria bacterium]